MRLRNLFFLYLQRVRTHPLEELLALLGIAVGVALVFAVQVANTSVTGSVRELVRGVTGHAALQVTSRDVHGFPAALDARIARVPGVRATAPVLELRVAVRGPRALRTANLVGGDARLVRMGGQVLREFSSPHLRLSHAVALPAPLARELGTGADGRIDLLVGASARTVPVATILSREQIGPLIDSPVVLAPLGYAQQIGGMSGRVTRILVATRPGATAAVRAALTRQLGARLNVSAGDEEAHLLGQATAPNDQSTALFATISALVGLLFAFNAMLLTVPERRRFLADLRLEGIGDAAIVRLVLFDALVLGFAASAAGLALGDLLSHSAFHAVPGYLSFAFAVGGQRIVEPSTVLFAVAGGVAATLIAALRPLSDLFSRRPLDDVYREDDERDEDAVLPRRRLLALGMALVAAASGVLLLAPPATVAGIALLVGGMLLLLPGILAIVVRLLDALSHRLRSAVLVVSVGELRTTTTRSLALAATGSLAVFGSVAVEGSHFDLQRGLDHDAHLINAQADLWVTPTGQGNVLATIPFRPPRRAAIAALPGVRAVRDYRGAFLDVDGRRVWVVAPARADATPIFSSELAEGDLATATRRLRAGGWVALSSALVEHRHLHVGSVVTLPTPRPVPLRLAASLTNLGWSSGAVVLNASDFRRAWGSPDVSGLQVLLARDAQPGVVGRELRRALGPHSGLAIESAAQREQRFRANTRQGLNRLTQIATLVLIAAALALATAMSGVIWNRRPRLVTLKLSGFGDGDVWRAVVLESAIVLGAGCSVGALFGLYGQFMLTRWLAVSTGFPTSYATAGWLALSTFAAVTVVAVAIAALPGYAAARVAPTAGAQGD